MRIPLAGREHRPMQTDTNFFMPEEGATPTTVMRPMHQRTTTYSADRAVKAKRYREVHHRILSGGHASNRRFWLGSELGSVQRPIRYRSRRFFSISLAASTQRCGTGDKVSMVNPCKGRRGGGRWSRSTLVECHRSIPTHIRAPSR